MDVLVNALPLRHGGGVTYLQQQMAAMARVAPELRFRTLLSPWSQVRDLPGISETVKVRSVPTRFAYEQFRVPFRRSDLLYCPANFGPMYFRGPIVLTLQNANYCDDGLALADAASSRPPWKVLANHLGIKRADAVVVISQSLADQVLKTVPSAGSKLHLIRSGASTWPGASEPVDGLPESYFVSIASAAPHKRVPMVVAAWRLSQEAAAKSTSLVLIGRHTAAQMQRHRSIAGPYAHLLIHLGWLRSRTQLKWIYEHARAMVLMSALESFSLAPIEAGSVGCPVILSDIPVHREVAGTNGHYVALDDTSSLATLLLIASTWEPGSSPWTWPVTWDENARQLTQLFTLLTS